MNEIVAEWVDKAGGDYLTATREIKADCVNFFPAGLQVKKRLTHD